VTVGSTAPFDELTEEADRLAGSGVLEGAVIQIGNGRYVPKNAEWFRFEGDLTARFREAEFIITHGGAGTLFEIVRMGKRAIVVPNPNAVNNPDIVEKLSADGHVLLCPEVGQLEGVVGRVRGWVPKEYREPPCRIHEVIAEFLLGPSEKDGREAL